VPGANEVRSHGFAHLAKTEESDLHNLPPLGGTFAADTAAVPVGRADVAAGLAWRLRHQCVRGQTCMTAKLQLRGSWLSLAALPALAAPVIYTQPAVYEFPLICVPTLLMIADDSGSSGVCEGVAGGLSPPSVER